MSELVKKSRSIAIKEELLRNIFNKSVSPKLVFEAENETIIWVNQALSKLYRVSADSIVRKAFDEFDPLLFKSFFSKASTISSNESVSFMHTVKLKGTGGKSIEVFVHKLQVQQRIFFFLEFLLLDAWNETQEYLMEQIFSNTMKTKKKEDKPPIEIDIKQLDSIKSEKDELEKQIAMIAQSKEFALYTLKMIDKSTMILEWATESFTTMTGYTPQEVDEDGGWYSIIIPSHLPDYRDSQMRLERDKMVVTVYRILTRNGKAIWVRDHIIPEMDYRNSLVRVRGLLQDITVEKSLQTGGSDEITFINVSNKTPVRKLDTDHHFDIIFSQFPMAIFHDDGVIIDINKAFEEEAEYKKGEIQKLTIDILVDMMYQSTIQSVLSKQLKTPYAIGIRKRDQSVMICDCINTTYKYKGRIVEVFLMRKQKK